VVQQLQDLTLRLGAAELPAALERRLVHDLHREPRRPRGATTTLAQLELTIMDLFLCYAVLHTLFIVIAYMCIFRCLYCSTSRCYTL
jgi:hypothetical protein